MRARAIAALLVVVVLLSVGVAVASHALAVGSIHTDFGTDSEATPTALTNISIVGTGSSADAALRAPLSYNSLEETGDGTTDFGGYMVGDNSGNDIFSSEARLTPTFSGQANSVDVAVNEVSGTDYGFVVDVYLVAEQPDGTYGEGTLVADGWDPDFTTGDQRIQFDNPTPVSAGQDYSLEFVTQSTDSDSTTDGLRFNVDSSTVYANGHSLLGSIHDGEVVEVTLNGYTTETDGRYVSATHSVENAEQTFTDLTLQNAEAIIRWEYYDGSAWQVANTATLTTSTNHTLDISGHASATQWRANVSFTDQAGTTTAEIHDEGVLVYGSEPTASNPDPSGGETITGTTPTLSVDVNDPDFGLTQGDEVTAEFYLDSSLVDTQTTTFNGTLDYSPSSLTGGSHTWHVELTDEYGHSVTSNTWSFQTPDEMRIYNESAPDTLIQSPTEVTVQFFAENGSTYTRTTTDGTIDFAGLPVDQEFTVTASADGYRTRTMTIESLVQQSDVYLLPESATAANVVYSLVDNSGDFSPPEETVLYIEKPLTIDGSTTYQTITSSAFSATNEIPVALENDHRYRLRLESGSHTRVLGSYTTAGDDAATLTVGQVSFGGASASNPSFTSTVTEIDGTRVLEIKYYDPANATDALTIGVTNRSSGATFRPETTETGPFGTYREIIPIASNKEYVSYNVTYTAHRSDFEDQSGTIFTGDLPHIAQELGVDPRILSGLAYLVLLSTLGLFAISSPRFSGIPTAVVAVGLVGFGAVAIHPLVLSGIGVMALLFAVGGGR